MNPGVLCPKGRNCILSVNLRNKSDVASDKVCYNIVTSNISDDILSCTWGVRGFLIKGIVTRPLIYISIKHYIQALYVLLD